MGAVVERDLGAGERAQTERLCGLRELHRAVEPIVVGERHRRVALVDRDRGELDRKRRPVEERVSGVGVQLDIGH